MYHNIYKTRNGVYQIIKNNTDYGTFDNLADALHERDLLEGVGWDLDLLCDLKTTHENKYRDMDLPPFEHIPKYIQIETQKTKVKFVIKKRFGVKLKRFGRYDSLEEAEKVRDLLIENDWDKKKVKRILREERLQFS